jgi:hypothetical protein
MGYTEPNCVIRKVKYISFCFHFRVKRFPFNCTLPMTEGSVRASTESGNAEIITVCGFPLYETMIIHTRMG